MLDINAVKELINYFNNDKNAQEFYIALLLYDVLGFSSKDISYEDVEYVYQLQDEYDSIYNEDLRERLREKYQEEQEQNNDEQEKDKEQEIEI